MYIDNQIKMFGMTWPPIAHHTYQRVSRSKWRIQINYACGAETILEDIPDDFIQSLVLGAFNSRLDISTNVKEIPPDIERPAQPFTTWKELQPLVLDD